jgi:UDP-N-acetylmuramoyl-tripeptide--D-alanyl-D-alanine ligase
MEISQLHQLYLDHPKVQTDTRKIAKGEIFFALKGENFNGNTFAIKALELGAAYVVIDESEYNDINDDRYILVDNVLDTLQASTLPSITVGYSGASHYRIQWQNNH